MSPIIVEGPYNQAILQGDEANFHCQVFAEPQHELDWLYGDEMLTNTSNIKIKNNNLTIINANLSMAGNYSCAVRNIHGSTMNTALLEIQGYIKHSNRIIILFMFCNKFHCSATSGFSTSNPCSRTNFWTKY